jgi:hypothetical protein
VRIWNSGNHTLNSLTAGYAQSCDDLSELHLSQTATCNISYPVFAFDFEMWDVYDQPLWMTVPVYQYEQSAGMAWPVIVATTTVAVPLVAMPWVEVVQSTANPLTVAGALTGDDC